MTRPISAIANEIVFSWKKVNYAAVPYLEAMAHIDTIGDQYFADSARSVVAYFLANAGSWRGDDARRIKKELRAL